MRLSIIIPAYNEEKCLPPMLEAVSSALSILPYPCELIVIDNESTDNTREIAESFGARVVTEKEHNISRVRNAGAEIATGETLIFLDADTLVPQTLFQKIAEVMEDQKCMGGAVFVEYAKVRRRLTELYLRLCKFGAKVFNMKQGAAQFCRSSAFKEIRGYDESIYVGEDVELYWRLSKYAKQNSGYVHFIKDLRVTTSSRRFDRWSLWKTVVFTHPIFIVLLWRRKSHWKDWYENAIR
ncbi:MAG TPA: glycosyltransferase [Pyrinomonadaceae bacterium]|nr:glycosyltransferase [Pyrinomonadaceae bacterium]